LLILRIRVRDESGTHARNFRTPGLLVSVNKRCASQEPVKNLTIGPGTARLSWKACNYQ